MSRYYRGDERERSRERRRDRSRDRSLDRARRSPTYGPEDVDEGQDEPSVLAWIPSASIDYDVISEDLPLYMGANSKVERAKNPKDGRTPGYLVKGPYTLTVAMLSDLKRDTIDWEEERSKSGNRDYRRSETRNRRRGVGPTRKLANPAPVMAQPPQRTDSIPIPPGRRPDDTRAGFVDASPRVTGQFTSNYPPERTSSRQQVPTSVGYNEPSRSADIYSRHEASETTAQNQRRDPSTNPLFSPTTNTQDTSQPRNPAGSVPQSGDQPTYTRADVARSIAQKLKDEGHTGVDRDEFNRAVDDAFRKLQQQQSPPPYSKTPSTQPNTTGTRGFSNPTATAGPKPDSGYGGYRY